MASVAITRTELGSAGLRAAAAGSSDAKQARRLLALAMVLDGHPRLLAAQAGGMDRQTLRDWVHRYNAHGIEGLRDTRNKGRAPALSAEQMQELEGLVLARIIHEKCAIKAKPLLSLTIMRMDCLMKFFAMKSLAQVFGGLGRFRAVR